MLTFVPATIGGSFLLTTLSPNLLMLIVGLVALCFAALSLANLHLHVPPRLEAGTSTALGVVAGTLNGSTSIPGPLFAIYLSSLRLDKRAFVYGLTLLFSVGNATQLVAYSQLGLYDGVLLYALLLVPSALLGQQLGFAIQDRLQPAVFQRVVIIVVALSGANLVARALGVI